MPRALGCPASQPAEQVARRTIVLPGPSYSACPTAPIRPLRPTPAPEGDPERMAPWQAQRAGKFSVTRPRRAVHRRPALRRPPMDGDVWDVAWDAPIAVASDRIGTRRTRAQRSPSSDSIGHRLLARGRLQRQRREGLSAIGQTGPRAAIQRLLARATSPVTQLSRRFPWNPCGPMSTR